NGSQDLGDEAGAPGADQPEEGEGEDHGEGDRERGQAGEYQIGAEPGGTAGQGQDRDERADERRTQQPGGEGDGGGAHGKDAAGRGGRGEDEVEIGAGIIDASDRFQCLGEGDGPEQQAHAAYQRQGGLVR